MKIKEKKRFKWWKLFLSILIIIVIGLGGGYWYTHQHLKSKSANDAGWSKIDGTNVLAQLPANFTQLAYGQSSIVASTGHFNKAITYQTYLNITPQYLYMIGIPTVNYDNEYTQQSADKTKKVAKGTQDKHINDALFPKDKSITQVQSTKQSITTSATHLNGVTPPTLDFKQNKSQILLTRIAIHDVIKNGGPSYTIEGLRSVYKDGQWVNQKQHQSINLLMANSGKITYSDALLSGQFKPVNQSIVQVAKNNHFNYQIMIH